MICITPMCILEHYHWRCFKIRVGTLANRMWWIFSFSACLDDTCIISMQKEHVYRKKTDYHIQFTIVFTKQHVQPYLGKTLWILRTVDNFNKLSKQCPQNVSMIHNLLLTHPHYSPLQLHIFLHLCSGNVINPPM